MWNNFTNSLVFYAQKCFKRINKNGGQRHHRQRVHARVAGSAKSERGVNALGGHLFRVRGVYESFWRVDGDLEERERRENKDRVRVKSMIRLMRIKILVEYKIVER